MYKILKNSMKIVIVLFINTSNNFWGDINIFLLFFNCYAKKEESLKTELNGQNLKAKNLVNPTSKYYDDLLKWYKRYSPEHMHIGMWKPETKTHEEALKNTVVTVIDLLDVDKEDVILDAGCGIGGASRYVVETYQVRTTGINLSQNLLEEALRLNADFKYKSLLDFFLMDYANTSFENSSFSKIFAIDSVCHAEKKEIFVKEAFRLLKSEGRLIICDAFRSKINFTSKEEKLYRKALDGWLIPNLPTVVQFKQILIDLGFKNITYYDKVNEIKISSLRLFNRSRKVRPFTYLLCKLRIWPKSVHLGVSASYYQKACLEKDLTTYGILLAEK